ncbi:MAG: urease subunit beta [Nitrospirae bacterium]|nr:urease subunit beta [Nitrospirota bacterium]
MKPGEYFIEDADIQINSNRRTVTLVVTNTGDRPVQVGSHFHFFEVNKALVFQRELAFGMRLDIAAGTAVRFEPGQQKEVTLVEFGGQGYIKGLNNLTNGFVHNEKQKKEALKRAKNEGFGGA